MCQGWKTDCRVSFFYPWGGWAWLLVLQHCHSCTDSRQCQPTMGCHVPRSLWVSSGGAHCPRTSPHRRTPPAAWTATGRWRAANWALRGWRRDWDVYRPPLTAPGRSPSPWRSWTPGGGWDSPKHGDERWSGRSLAAVGGAAPRTGSVASSATWSRSGRWSCRVPDFLHCDRGF